MFSTKLNDIPRLRDEFYNLTVDTEVVWLRELRKRKPKNYRFIEPTEDDFQEYDEYGNAIYDHDKFSDDYYVSGNSI